MAPEEFSSLIDNFGTRYFNIHSQKEFPCKYDLSPFRKIILVENNIKLFDEEEAEACGGICLDVSHLESHRLVKPDLYQKTVAMLEKYPVKANHISAVLKNPPREAKDANSRSRHYLSDLTELDYLKKYPKKYFGEFIAIELENDLKTQLKAKSIIEDILNS
jgi:hypothetical protein